MFHKLVPAVAASAALLFSAPGFAASSTQPASAKPAAAKPMAAKPMASKIVTGEIASLDVTGNTLVIQLKTKTETFSLAPQAVLTAAGKPAKLSDFKVGQKVEVTYDLKDGKMIASHVAGLGHA